MQPGDLDDYLTECDEHLSVIRNVLLDLEVSRDLAATSRDKLDTLFRGFHSIKGLSGMVGARAVENVAHELEAYLVAVRTGEVFLSSQGIELLLDGTALIETSITAFQKGESLAETDTLAERIVAMLPAHPERKHDDRRQETPDGHNLHLQLDLSQANLAKLNAAVLRGERLWQVTFHPAAELAAKGINVASVRSRLQAAGEIVLAEPITIPGGVRFVFVVTAPASSTLDQGIDEGIDVQPFQIPSERSVTPLRASRVAGIVPANLVRVDLSRLDDLMQAVGELVLSRARLDAGIAKISKYLPAREQRELEEATHAIERQLRDLREGVMRVRMIPVRDLLARMRLVVRDLTRETGKQIDFITSGEDTEIDKLVVERMGDPLLHLVRNAVSHGLELPADRQAAGKSPTGRLQVSAAIAGGRVVLEVTDDGRGIDPEAVFEHARAAGFVSPESPTNPGAVLDLLCTPGFSTRVAADRGSGRGVGMDVVRHAVEGLGGSVSMESQVGLGSRFIVRLPLTLVILDVLTIAVGGQLFAIPQSAVREVLPVEPGSSTVLENNELIRYHGSVLPLVHLGDVFDLPRPVGAFVAVVAGEGGAAVALAADRAAGMREVVVRSITDPLIQVPGIGGATELGDGRPILILDPAVILRLARRRKDASTVRTGDKS